MLATVSLASALQPLNSTLLTVALPDIRSDFDVGHAEIAWVVSAYLIAMVVSQPLGGRIGDQIGHATALRWSMVAFAAFSLAAAVAPSFVLLVAFRAGQALAGGALAPVGIAMLRTSVVPSRLGQAAGVTNSVVGLSATVGPLIGAALLGIGSWRWLFLANLPIVAAGVVCLSILKYSHVAGRRHLELDLLGSLSLAGVFTAATYLVGTGLRSGAAAAAVGLFGLAAALGAFWWSQAKGKTSVGEWSLFRSRSFAAATLFVLTSYMVMYTLLISIPFFIKEVKSGSDATAGLTIFSLTITMALASPIAGRCADRWGRRIATTFGGLFMITACLILIASLSIDLWFPFLLCALLFVGASFGAGTNMAMVAAVEAAPMAKAGAAAGTTALMRYTGGIAGAALLGLILSDAATPGVEPFRLLFAVLLVIACAATWLSFSIHRFADNDEEPEQLAAFT